MRNRRLRRWSPRLAITTAVIVTGVVGAPIARADDGADPGVPSGAGVAAAVADAVVPALTGSESPMAAVASVPSLPPVSQAAEALEPVTPSPAPEPVVPSQPEQPPPAAAADPAPPPASPTAPSAEAAPPAERPGSRDSAVTPDRPVAAAPAGSESPGDITATEPTTSEQPEAAGPTGASQLGPVNIQVSIRVASPGDNGAVTQVNAVVTAATGSAAPLLPDHTDHVDPPASPGESRDIGGDITGVVDDSRHDSTQDPMCNPNGGCCAISLLAGLCLDRDAGGLSGQDIARILGAIIENSADNSDVTAQYQGNAVQYRPINISVSIRISSPGNDGPVVQTNLVHVQASIAVEVSQAVQPLPGPLDPTAGLAPADGDVAEQEPVDAASESVADASAPADIEADTTSILAPTLLETPFPLSSGPVSRRLNAISRLAWGVGRPPSVAWITPVGSPGAGTDDTVRGAADKTSQRRASRVAAPTAPPAAPWVPVAFSVVPAPASSGGGGSGGGLAIALSLPFVLALFYSGLRRLRTSGSAPSAHIDREPERPG